MKKLCIYLWFFFSCILSFASCSDEIYEVGIKADTMTSFKSDKRKVSNPKIDYSIGEKGGRPSGGEYVDPIQINATCYDQLLQITLKATKHIMKAKIKVLDNQRNLILEQKDLSIAQEWTFCIFSMAEGYPYFLKLETDAIDFWASIHEPGQKSWFPEDEE